MAYLDLIDWNDLSLADLFFAYRKAKVDCFYESSIRVSEAFIAYEQALPDRLSALLVRIHSGEVAQILADGINQPIIFPKRLNFEQKPEETRENEARSAHAFFSDAKRALGQALDQKAPVPEFRLIGDFSVEVHILSALWVNLVGHKFDACLSSHALASRVRRYRADKNKKWLGDYHLEFLAHLSPISSPIGNGEMTGLT